MGTEINFLVPFFDMNPKTPYFEYRVVKLLVDNKYPSYKLAEVFFDNGIPVNYTIIDKIASFPNPNLGISDEKAIKELKDDVVDMLRAFDLNFIDGETLTEL